MLMVQRRKRTQFTAKFKEKLEKVETIIQEAIENLPVTEDDEMMDILDTKEDVRKEMESSDSSDKEYCSSLDRIMCQIVDELNCDSNTQ